MAVFPPPYFYSAHADGQSADAADINTPFGELTDTVNGVIAGCNTLNTQVQDHEAALSELVSMDRSRLIAMNDIRPDEVVDITAAVMAVSSAAGEWIVLNAVNVTADNLVAGAGGIDAPPPVAADTPYTVWVIYNPNTATTDGLLSLSPDAPTLPAGYTYSRRVGVVMTDGASDFHPYVQVPGTGEFRIYPSDAGGAEPGVTNILGFVNNVFTDVNWLGLLPTCITNVIVRGYMVTGVAAAASDIALRPNGSAAARNYTTIFAMTSSANTDSGMGELSVSLDSNGIFEAAISDNSIMIANLMLAGWYDDI